MAPTGRPDLYTIKDINFPPPVAVGAAPGTFPDLRLPEGVPLKGVVIQAHPDNSEPVYIGMSPSLTADTAATGGFPLSPDRSVTLLIRDLTRLRHVSASGGQFLNLIAQ